MRLLKASRMAVLVFAISVYSQANAVSHLRICMTGRIVKSLPSYGESFVNAAYLAKEKNKLTSQVEIKTYFFDNRPLEPVSVYKKMIQDGCSAIIGFEYLSDLLLAVKSQKDEKIPIFSSYASINDGETFPKNIFMFMPHYSFLSNKMVNFLNKKFGKIDNVLLITEINREEMQKYKEAYSQLFNENHINFDSFSFLENDGQLDKKLSSFLKGKKYKFIFLLSDTIASAKISDYMNNNNVIFIGTENYGSSVNQSYLIRLKNKKINAFFVRNLDFLKTNKNIEKFRIEYSKKYHVSPTILSVYTFDAANIILNSFEKNYSANTDNIYQTNYAGVSGAYLKSGQFFRSKDYVILSVATNGYRYEE